MSMRLLPIIIFFTFTSDQWLFSNASRRSISSRRSFTRRAGEYENAICEPSKRHLDLDGCGECICNSHGYGSVCENIYCPRVYKRPIDERECTPYEDFQTHCHFCKCSSSGIPIDCEEKQLGCMDKMIERLKVERFRDPGNKQARRSYIKRMINDYYR